MLLFDQSTMRIIYCVWYVFFKVITGVARRGQRGHGPPKFLENIVILCFERRFSKQNSVIRLNQTFCPPPNFWAGYASVRDSCELLQIHEEQFALVSKSMY